MRAPAMATLVAATLSLVVPATAPAQDPTAGPNPCLADPGLRCPDLVMAPPRDFDLDASPSGKRLILRQENSIVNVGRGPAELFGTRRNYTFMDARQVIADAAGVRRRYTTGAVLEYTSVPTRGGDYWKMQQAARFELWRIDGEGRRTELVRTGPKLNYCLRDLDKVRSGPLVPRRRVFGACNQSSAKRSVTLGTSVGWADVYPTAYPGNWIDVTGRRGCFAMVHRADPLNRLHELDEANNIGVTRIRLPYRPGPQRCP